MAQMSVTTIGATDARLCYEAAQDPLTTSTLECDQALKRGNLSVRDELATHVNRGVLLNRSGRVGEAIDEFDYALERNETLAEAYLNRGNSYYFLKRYDEAIADYDAALKYELTKAHIAWYNIGLAYEAKKDTLKAKDAYRTSLSIQSDFAPAQKKIGGGEADQD
ncbi:MAG: tetratricopeptide repeat protein [Parvularculaceae bacterium]|nr:tetratricopeptide repeat protein [Parvularculaceae bacterium]